MDEPQEGEERGKKKTMLAGKPDYLQKLKVPEGYEKINDYSNI